MIEFIIFSVVVALIALIAWLYRRHKRRKAIINAVFSGDMEISNVIMTGKFKSD